MKPEDRQALHKIAAAAGIKGGKKPALPSLEERERLRCKAEAMRKKPRFVSYYEIYDVLIDLNSDIPRRIGTIEAMLLLLKGDLQALDTLKSQVAARIGAQEDSDQEKAHAEGE